MITPEEREAGEQIRKDFEAKRRTINAKFYEQIEPFEKERAQALEAALLEQRIALEELWPDLIEKHNQILGPKPDLT